MSLWFFWFIATVSYGVSFGAAFLFFPLGIPAAFLGLFVPMLFGNFGQAVSGHKGYMVFPLMFVTLAFGDFIGSTFLKHPVVHAVFNALVLSVLTYGVDMILWGKYATLESSLILLFR